MTFFIEFLSNPATLSAVTAMATLSAAYATWKAPRIAAKLQDNYQSAYEKKRQKLWIFATIMQSRPYLAKPETVNALNVIDVVFSDNKDVRDAWASLYQVLHQNDYNNQLVSDKTSFLLNAMAKDLGYDKTFGTSDFHRVYYPKALVDADELQFLQQKATRTQLNQILGQNQVDSDSNQN